MSNPKSVKYYYRLWKALEWSIKAPTMPNGDELSCHSNNIVVELAKVLTSGYQHYDASFDSWLGYFMRGTHKNLGMEFSWGEDEID